MNKKAFAIVINNVMVANWSANQIKENLIDCQGVNINIKLSTVLLLNHRWLNCPIIDGF